MTMRHHANPFTVALLAFSLVACEPSAKEAENGPPPPKASAQEAEIKHWSMRAIKRTFWDIRELETAYISTYPTDLRDGLSVKSLEQSGANVAKIKALADEIAEQKHAEVDSLLIAHKSDLVFEAYFRRGRVDLSHPQSSTTKSYTSLALGRAIALGYLSLADLDRPIASFFDTLDPSTFAPGAKDITLREALTMQSGLAIGEDQMKAYREASDDYQGIQQLAAYLRDSTPIQAADKGFNYQGQNPDMIMQVIEAVVPGSAQDFIKTEVFGKLGISNYDWRLSRAGLPSAGSFSSLTSRDMLKVGQLVMNKGRTQDGQLIPEAFLAAATKRQTDLTDEQAAGFYSGDALSNSGYGYYWWLTDMTVDDKTYLAKSAQGGGGVTIVLVEDLDLVIVVTAHARQAYLQMIAEHILPAFIS